MNCVLPLVALLFTWLLIAAFQNMWRQWPHLTTHERLSNIAAALLWLGLVASLWRAALK